MRAGATLALACLVLAASPASAAGDTSRSVVQHVIVLPERPVADGALRASSQFELNASGTAGRIEVDGPVAEEIRKALQRWILIPLSAADCRHRTRRISVAFEFDPSSTTARLVELAADGVAQPLDARVTVPYGQFPRDEQFGTTLDAKLLTDGRAPVTRMLPAYPTAAMLRKITGSAAVRFEVDAQGKVFDAEFIEELPSSRAVPGVLRSALRDAVRRMRFEPGAGTSSGCATATFYRSGYLFESGINSAPRERYSGGR